MRRGPRFRLATLVLTLVLMGAAALAQRRDAFVASRNHAAIGYATAETTDPVTALNRRLQTGGARLTFDPANGYLKSLLDALGVPVESQALVFSQTSFQAPKINYRNPRAIYFNDTVAVGWVRGGDIIEVAAQDPAQGVVFYALDQKQSKSPSLKRNDDCLACHLSWETLGVPGLMVESVHPLPDEISYVNGYNTIHASPLNERWGGWWVTGNHGGARHLGNIPVMPADKGKLKLASPTRVLATVEGQFDLAGYPTAYSDVVAQLVLAHQVRMTNMITRVGWEARLAASAPSADASARVREAATDLVDYLLFVDEAPFVGPMQGSSGFAEWFAKQGPRDAQGRSFREFDLRRRLFKYPCSYMIYTPAFDAMPAAAKEAVYARMWEVLSGREKRQPYASRLTAPDRQAIVEILRATKKDLPSYFVSTRS
ncbi:MAG TPA: hypothetical protein VFV78_06275 [Vicinamibacterales bacterium]|nr:hypothetical protein [Vicinamibacterales bacterium]